MTNHLIKTIGDSLRDNWNLAALSDFNGKTYTYGQVARKIARLHLVFEMAGLNQGDRMALCARNSADWAAVFLSILGYGAVVVPLLHEFQPGNIVHLTTHSGARVLFTEKTIFDNLDTERMPKVDVIVLLDNLEVVYSRDPQLNSRIAGLDASFNKKYPNGFGPKQVRMAQPDPQGMALINYTSGSTGNSKGVMLSYNNLWSNVDFAMRKIRFYKPGDGMLSMLPLAHMYGLVFEFLFPFCEGCHITFLGRVPSPKVVLEAFGQVRPKMVITVPLVIEKIVRTRVFPALKKPTARFLLAIPLLRRIVYKKVRKQLLAAFGGNLKQLILGGAPLTSEVESFLYRIKFPFTVGYGMTECAPLVTYEWWKTQRPHSCGRVVDGMEARVDSPDPEHVPGVLYLRGANVMMGYYDNPEATAEAISADGWLDTGDICTIDKDGYVYIRGRQKSMFLGPSGQNIYPEEIEIVLNDLPLVAESVVVERNGKIVALVHPDYDAARRQGLTEQEANEKVKALTPTLNSSLPSYARINEIEIHPDEFEKTPKHSIRRFIYK